jgi:hypothetical protein
MADECSLLKDGNAASEAIRHLDKEDLRFLNRRIVNQRMEERNRSEVREKTLLRPDRQGTLLGCKVETSLAGGAQTRAMRREMMIRQVVGSMNGSWC